MTVPAQTSSQSIVATAGQTVFPFTFRCDDSSYLTAYAADVAQGGFGIALNADQVASPGGTITLAAQVVGVVVTIERAMPKTQTAALGAYGPFPSASVMAALDRIVQLMQDFYAQLVRAFRVTRANLLKVASLDLPAPQLGAMLGWVDAGGGLYRLGNITGVANGEGLIDSGDHIHFTSAHVPLGPGSVYRNGQRIFIVDDYTFAAGVWTLLVALDPATEKLNADYTY